MINELKEGIKNRNVILFVGAGVSATLKLPTWGELINHLSTELGYNNELFNLYGDNLSLAEYYELTKGDLKSLVKWMKSKWAVDQDAIKQSKTYEAIVKLNFPIIYTTNYDHCLETAHKQWKKPWRRIIGVKDLVNLKPSETQIVKFHGDISSTASIVLTESSYFERLSFESPLDIKLRSDMLGKSILFIGYSLSDINMRLLIYKLDQLWQKSNKNGKRPKSYLFMAAPNPIQEKILESRGINTIIGKDRNRTKSLEDFLWELIEVTH